MTFQGLSEMEILAWKYRRNIPPRFDPWNTGNAMNTHDSNSCFLPEGQVYERVTFRQALCWDVLNTSRKQKARGTNAAPWLRHFTWRLQLWSCVGHVGAHEAPWDVRNRLLHLNSGWCLRVLPHELRDQRGSGRSSVSQNAHLWPCPAPHWAHVEGMHFWRWGRRGLWPGSGGSNSVALT